MTASGCCSAPHTGVTVQCTAGNSPCPVPLSVAQHVLTMKLTLATFPLKLSLRQIEMDAFCWPLFS
jgi:hypothetical protein